MHENVLDDRSGRDSASSRPARDYAPAGVFKREGPRENPRYLGSQARTGKSQAAGMPRLGPCPRPQGRQSVAETLGLRRLAGRRGKGSCNIRILLLGLRRP